MAHYPDPGLFHPDAISHATRTDNDALARRLAELPAIVDFAEARRRFARGDGPIPTTPRSPRAVTLNIPGKRGEVGLRLIAPPAPTGVLLHVHGGSWTMGSADMRDGDLERVVQNTGLACVSVEYRLAPEHPYPAAPDDCESAANWLVEHAASRFGTNRLLIGGESAGAHLAALTLLRLRDSGRSGIFAGANLVFGAYDLSSTPSVLLANEGLIIDRPRMERMRAAFVPAGLDRRDPGVSPLYADLRDMPRALFTVGTLDPMLDDSLFMHARWIAAGNQGELAVYPGGVHGFTAFDTELARQAMRRIDQFLADTAP